MTTPEPWEESAEEIYDMTFKLGELCNVPPDKKEKQLSVLEVKNKERFFVFIRTLRTAAYEQGKREAEAAKEKEHHECTEDIVRQLDEALNARNNLLTALKSVLGEKRHSIAKDSPIITGVVMGFNELHYTLTRFIKEQEDNQDKHE